MQAILRKQSGITQLLIKAEQLGYMVHAKLLLRLSLCSVLQIAKRSHKRAAPTAKAAPFLFSGKVHIFSAETNNDINHTVLRK